MDAGKIGGDGGAVGEHDLSDLERERVAPYVTDTARTGLRAHQPARGGQGRALRALLAQPQVAAAPAAGRVPAPPMSGTAGAGPAAVGEARAEALYERVLAEYGDDSVAQLGGAHVAVEGASNLLTKVIQWGRLASYLEQSTRYIPYTDRPGGRFRYHRPAAVMAHPEHGPAYAAHARRSLRGLRRAPAAAGRARGGPGAGRSGGARRGARPGDPRRGPSTCCAACCRRPRRPTWASSAPARPTRRC